MFLPRAITAILLALGASAATLPSGTDLLVRLEQQVEPGGKKPRPFSATLEAPVFLNGKQALPAGSRIEGEVRGSKKHVVLSPRTLILPDGRKLDFNAAVREIDHDKLQAEEKEGTIQGGGSKADATRQAAQVGRQPVGHRAQGGRKPPLHRNSRRHPTDADPISALGGS